MDASGNTVLGVFMFVWMGVIVLFLLFEKVKLLEKIEMNLPSQTLLLDLKNVIYVDTSGIDTIMELAHLCKIRNIRLIICGLAHQPLEMAERSDFISSLPQNSLYPDLITGIEAATA